jgi:hypothetical protein
MKIEKVYNLSDLSKDYQIAKFGKSKSRETTKINSIYKDIYKELFNEMVKNKYTLLLGGCFRLSIVRQVRNYDRLAVNWGASNKLKKEIIDKGGKPASKIGVDAKGNPKFDDGERWMVFYTDFDFIKLLSRRVRYKSVVEDRWKLNVKNSWYWKPVGNIKIVKRINKYIAESVINREDIQLYDKSKESFF